MQALKSDDKQAPKRLAHTLKGMAGTIGAKDVEKTAGALELACEHSTSASDIRVLEDAINIALVPVLQGLSELTFENLPVKTSEKALDLILATEILQRLRALVEEDDAEATFVIEELNDLAGITKYSGLLKKLTKAVDSYDFDEALELLVKLEKSVI